MRPDTKHLFQVLGKHKLSYQLILVVIKTVEDSGANIVDPALLGSVQRCRVPVVVAFGTDGMHFGIGRSVESLLEEDEGADVRGF